jgi:hypothetical protein
MNSQTRREFLVGTAAVIAASATSSVYGQDQTAAQQTPNMPKRNPWLTDSVYPTSHFNPGATDSVLIAGPRKGKKLVQGIDAKVLSNVMVSNPTVKRIGSDTVGFASGAFGIRKILLTGTQLESISYTPYPGMEQAAAKADEKSVNAVLADFNAAATAKDEGKMLAATTRMEQLGLNLQNGSNGAYNMFDSDGFHYCVFGGTKVLKSTDGNSVRGAVRVVKVMDVTAATPPRHAKAVSKIIAMNMTYDGYIAATAPNAIVVLDRDLNVKSFLPFENETIENGMVIDEDNGIYVVTSRQMRKIRWTGRGLSIDERDGAWNSGYDWLPNGGSAVAAVPTSSGAGTTPTLMGFGDDPHKLVVILDAVQGAPHLVAFWRDRIPYDFIEKPFTKTKRVADQIRIDISQVTVEPSPNVLGYGVAVMNGTYPKPLEFTGFSNTFIAGVTRAAPLGIQKFMWNTKTSQFDKAWINRDVDNSDIMLPVVSAATGLMYCASKQNGNYEYVGLDWMTGELRESWVFPDDSRVWNAYGGITTVLENGDLLIGGMFGIKRVVAS